MRIPASGILAIIAVGSTLGDRVGAVPMIIQALVLAQ